MTNNNTFEKVTNRLRNKFEKDIQFNKELEDLVLFYGRKLLAIAKSSNTKEIIVGTIDNVVRSQYFQGYYIMTTILDEDEMKFPDKTWGLPLGILRNEIPKAIYTIFDNEVNFDWAANEVINEFAAVMIKELENGFDVVESLKYEVAAFGAYKAFLGDPRYKIESNDTKTPALLGNPFDLEFLNFQVFMQAQYYSNEHEIWDMFKMGIKGLQNEWCGNAHLSKFTDVQGNVNYLLSINISNSIRLEEKMILAEKVVKKIPNEILNTVQIRLYHTDSLEFLGLEEEKM